MAFIQYNNKYDIQNFGNERKFRRTSPSEWPPQVLQVVINIFLFNEYLIRVTSIISVTCV